MHARIRAAQAVLIVGAAVALAGCTPSPAEEAASSGSAAPTSTAEAAWLTFTTEDGLASWQLPPDWTVLPPWVDAQGAVDYEVLDADGASRLYYSHKQWGIGGPGCVPDMMESYPITRLDETPMSIPADRSGATPAVAFDVLDEGDRIAGMLRATATPITGPTSCEDGLSSLVFEDGEVGIISFSAHFDDGALPVRLDFPSLAKAEAYLESADYQTIVRVISSLSFDPSAATGPAATAAPIVPTAETSPLAGAYLVDAHGMDDCGTFPLTGQTLTVAGSEASLTTPGQTLEGTLTRVSRGWEVKVTAPDDATMVVLDGAVVDGVFQGSGSSGGRLGTGGTGWTCAYEWVTATPAGVPTDSGGGASTAVECGPDELAAAQAALGADAQIDPAARLCSGDWMVLGVIRDGNEHTTVLHSVDGAWQPAFDDEVCAFEDFTFDPEVGPQPGDEYRGPLPQELVASACFSN
ncbi:hypothetical protein ACGGZK_05860 [Agromyces sp. MMS24-K17]|uniref:hypothetical protein n=1 Tax=Agromyces sp. MMS24-K17 TaxID=3372850 RepID=UPI0037543DEB